MCVYAYARSLSAVIIVFPSPLLPVAFSPLLSSPLPHLLCETSSLLLTFIFVISSAWQLHLLLMLVFLPLFLLLPLSSIALWEKRKEIGRFIIIATLSIGRRRESVIASLMQSCLPFSAPKERWEDRRGIISQIIMTSQREEKERWCNHHGE